MADIFSIAEAAMRSNMAALDTVSHNVANAETRGFKRELHVSPAFDPHLNAALIEPDRTARDWSAGTLRRTGSAMNFAIEGEGFFQLRSPQGVVLTRDGEFQLDRSGRLVSPQGWPVMLDSDVGIGSSTPTLNSSKELWVDGERVAQFLLAKVDPKSLEAIGAGMYRATQAVETAESPTLRQGFLESSNVDTLTEMVDLMEAMRKAEASQRVVRAYDEALETAITTLGEF